MKTNIVTFLILFLISQLTSNANEELKKILTDIGRLEESNDVNPGIPGPAKTAYLKKNNEIIDRFISLGRDRDQMLADFFENPENEARLKESAISIFRKTYSKRAEDHPLLQSIRIDLQRVADSDFEYRGNIVGNCIILLNHYGDERDIPLLEALSRSDDPGYQWFCSLAIKQIKARAASNREPRRPSRSDTANQTDNAGEGESSRVPNDQPGKIFKTSIFIGAILLLVGALYMLFRSR